MLSLIKLNSDPKFEQKLTFFLKNGMRSLVNSSGNSGRSAKFAFLSYFCQKYVIFDQKKNTEELISEKRLMFPKMT